MVSGEREHGKKKSVELKYGSNTFGTMKWLKHFWTHENMFVAGVVRANVC